MITTSDLCLNQKLVKDHFGNRNLPKRLFSIEIHRYKKAIQGDDYLVLWNQKKKKTVVIRSRLQ